MVATLILLSCISLTVTSFVADENRYLDVECRQLLRECEGAQCLLQLIANPVCIEEQQINKAKRASRSKIREILLNSYLNRMG
ncbi:hypothetical protein GCK32_020139 [Trichostrongylus colubriformis]|uniref:Uncharacterized protein n=1 Tax=Trichostrongylus colubriformis TaxID=6319 RepID=A0AAN8G224_TRICO